MEKQNKFNNSFSKLLKFRELPLLLFIVVICVAVTIRTPIFFTLSNLNDIISDVVIYALLGIGEMIVITTGGIDFSIGTGLGLAAMVNGIIIVSSKNISPIFALLIGVFVGGLLGAFNGLLVTKGSMVALIATLATYSIFRGLNVVINLRFFKGEWVSADKLPKAFLDLTRNTTLLIPNLLIILIIFYIVFYYLMNFTSMGRQFYAVGSNINAARISGINVNKVIFLAYLISGMLFGLGGSLYVSRYATAQTNTGAGFEFIVITAVILGGISLQGGKGSIIGVLLGSILIGVITNALAISQISPFWRLAINGFILFIAVIVNKISENNILRRQKESIREF